MNLKENEERYMGEFVEGYGNQKCNYNQKFKTCDYNEKSSLII